jgi:hypothetical protein
LDQRRRDVTREHAFYEAPIYTDMVIVFRLPPFSNIRKNLADLLLKALDHY